MLAVVAALGWCCPAGVVGGGDIGWWRGVSVAAEETSVPCGRPAVPIHSHLVLMVLQYLCHHSGSVPFGGVPASLVLNHDSVATSEGGGGGGRPCACSSHLSRPRDWRLASPVGEEV